MGGTLKVLSLLSKKAVLARENPQDWSQQEIAEFYRAHHLLRQNGVQIGIDRGTSDVGEPWLAYYDERTDEVFMHIARIGGECVLICEHLGVKLSAPNIGSLIAAFEAEVRGYFNVPGQQRGKVILHPAARIIFSITAVFLLSKSDMVESALAAKGPGGVDGIKAEQEHWSQRKIETGLMHRLQQLMSSVHEVMDNPTAVAAIASFFLLQDTGIQSLLESREAEAADNASPGLHGTTPKPEAYQDDATEEASAAEDNPIVPELHANIEVVQSTPEGKHIVSVEQPLVSARVSAVRATPMAPQQVEEAAPAPKASAQATMGPEEPMIARDAPAAAASTAVAAISGEAAEEGSGFLSFQVLSDALETRLNGVAISEGILPSEPAAAGASDSSQTASQEPVAVATSSEPEPKVFATSFDETRVVAILNYFMDHIAAPRYYYGTETGELIVSDATISAGGNQSTWQNTMADGSVIKVVGLTELIDDYSQIFA